MATYLYKIEQVEQRPDGDNLYVALWKDGVVVDRKQVQVTAGISRANALIVLEAQMAPLVAAQRRTLPVATGGTQTPA